MTDPTKAFKVSATATFAAALLWLFSLGVPNYSAAAGARVPHAISGCWEITQALAAANVYGMSNKEIRHLIGVSVCYSDREISSEGSAMTNPSFRTTTYGAAGFFRWFHAPLTALALTAPVSVFNLVDAKGYPVRFFGDTVIAKDPGHLILARDGVFYLACMKSSDCAVQQAESALAGDYPKVGYGHLVMPGEDFSNGITKTEAQALYQQDAKFAAGGVNSAVHAKVTQVQFDALVALAFDIGNGAFDHSAVVSALNNGQPVKEAYFTDFDMSAGKADPAMKQSRSADWKLFSKGEYGR